jgi:hypothetical protein
VPTLFVLREGKMFHCDIGKRWNSSAESKNLCQPKEGVLPNIAWGHTSSAFSEMYDLAIEVARSVKAFNGCATQ